MMAHLLFCLLFLFVWSAGAAADDKTPCPCPDKITQRACSTKAIPVLGGVDFVQYFTDFANKDGTYDETKTGLVGSSSYQTTYNGFSFNFLSQHNKDLFDANPTMYAPQYGGFCAWGIAGEFCPSFPWAANCLGPNGNWGHWTIQNQRLFFFYKDDAKSMFLQDPSSWIASADERWKNWYPRVEDEPFSTKCYVSGGSYTYSTLMEEACGYLREKAYSSWSLYSFFCTPHLFALQQKQQ